MPRRKKATVLETRNAIIGSLREWGVHPKKHGKHSQFSRKVSSLATAIAQKKNSTADTDSKDLKKIPRDRNEAILMVYMFGLQEYIVDDEIDEFGYRQECKRLAEELEDSLELVMVEADDPDSILCLPPYYPVQDNRGFVVKVKRKQSFLRFKESDLDPFERFKINCEPLSSAEFAYEDCLDEGWLNGYAFEAIVASHAIHHESCYQCKGRNCLYWCGGSQESWKDLYCRPCQSCFEIKSKADRSTIDRIFQRNKIQGGSFRRWCQEDFEARVEGSDYIVVVSRKPSLVKSKWVWLVDVAEIDNVLPTVSVIAFVNEKNIPLKTIVTLKRRHPWFQIPFEENPDLQCIFQRSFEDVFPGEWERLKSETAAEAEMVPERAPCQETIDAGPSLEANPSDDLRAQLEALALDDWEDYSSE